MCPRTIRGSCMASQSSRTQAGIRCRGSSWAEWGLDLESVSGLAFLEDMGGAGITGDTTGTAGRRSTTTTPTFLTAEQSSIATTSIAAASITATSTVAMRSTGADRAAEVRGSEVLPLLTFSQELAPARSADLITAVTFEAFPLAGGRALEAVFMAAVVDDIASRL